MHSARFKVRDWLEEPAKWLSWAQDSSGNLKDQAWNLQQFWKALEPLKKPSLSTRQWGEVMLLDSRAQFLLGHHLLSKATQQARDAAVYAVDSAWARNFSTLGLSALPMIGEFLKKNDPGLHAAQQNIRKVHDQAQQAFRKSEELGAKASKAMEQAKVDPTLANRVQQGARSGQTITANSRTTTAGHIQRTSEGAGFRPEKALPDLLGSVPWWVWAAAGLVLAVVLTQGGGSTVVVSELRRRTA